MFVNMYHHHLPGNCEVTGRVVVGECWLMVEIAGSAEAGAETTAVASVQEMSA